MDESPDSLPPSGIIRGHSLHGLLAGFQLDWDLVEPRCHPPINTPLIGFFSHFLLGFLDHLPNRSRRFLAPISGSACDTVIYNKTYIFGLCCFWHRAPKTLGIS